MRLKIITLNSSGGTLDKLKSCKLIRSLRFPPQHEDHLKNSPCFDGGGGRAEGKIIFAQQSFILELAEN